MLKKLKRLALVAVAGFFAFAPPGTLIVGAALLVAFFGRVWLAVAAAVLAAGAITLLLVRKRDARRRGRADR